MKNKKVIALLCVVNLIVLFVEMRMMWVSGIALDEAQSYMNFFQDNIIFIWGVLALVVVSTALSLYLFFKR